MNKEEIIRELKKELNYFEDIIIDSTGNKTATNRAHNLLKELKETFSFADKEKRRYANWLTTDLRRRNEELKDEADSLGHIVTDLTVRNGKLQEKLDKAEKSLNYYIREWEKECSKTKR